MVSLPGFKPLTAAITYYVTFVPSESVASCLFWLLWSCPHQSSASLYCFPPPHPRPPSDARHCHISTPVFLLTCLGVCPALSHSSGKSPFILQDLTQTMPLLLLLFLTTCSSLLGKKKKVDLPRAYHIIAFF